MSGTTWLGNEQCDSMLASAASAYRQGEFKQAKLILCALRIARPHNPTVLKFLASTCILLDEHLEAETLYASALALEPDDPYALVALAEIKLRTAKIDEAAPLLKTLFALDPDGHHPAANRGRALVQEHHALLLQRAS